MSDENGDPSGLDLVPGMARIAASAWWHTSGWALQTSWRVSRRLMQAATDPATAVDLAGELRRAARQAIADLIDVANIDLAAGGPAADVAKRVSDAVPSSNGSRPEAGPSLRAEGEELLRRSRDVHYEEEAHPAYERILSELAPDEGRILRLLLFEGPQPAVDIKTGGPIGIVRSRLIAPGLSMIGARAGCRYPDRVPAYLNNLFRLGMVWFSKETLRDPMPYQVLEAQPDVLGAIHSVRQAKVVRRSIHLTPFGEDFCQVALAPEAPMPSVLPVHSAPPEAVSLPQPPSPVSGEAAAPLQPGSP